VWKLVLQLETRQSRKNGWNSFHVQHKKNNAFAIFNQFIVSALTHCVSTTLIGYRSQLPTAAPDPPAGQLNSIFSAKTDPRENPEKNADKAGQ
jgi:hypothetical protein